MTVANNEDKGNANRKMLRRECLKQLKEMSRENKRSPIKIEGRSKIDYEVITKHANTKKVLIRLELIDANIKCL